MDDGKCPDCGHLKLCHLTPGNWVNGGSCNVCSCQDHYSRSKT